MKFCTKQEKAYQIMLVSDKMWLHYFLTNRDEWVWSSSWVLWLLTNAWTIFLVISVRLNWKYCGSWVNLVCSYNTKDETLQKKFILPGMYKCVGICRLKGKPALFGTSISLAHFTAILICKQYIVQLLYQFLFLRSTGNLIHFHYCHHSRYKVFHGDVT